ncbi:unnamed protein product [Caenorhabditis auriculariae]|uniref:Putative tRNA (cytidine(32)/guanosine(34)-2'-O)-methyltransferase n=1 Tax=Caenorhabditis auriculariae TaxID=2777116 RepID=A0A8S1GZB4_9PELO|nr:unnamed protein product [Caenorhabditis auriculariae]
MGKTSKDKRDIYYRLAKEHKWRARSAFKLMQIDDEFHILRGVTKAVDLCAAPGSWSQVLSKRLYAEDKNAKIVAVDLQPMAPIPGVIQLQGDITALETANQVIEKFSGEHADIVVCDGAPDVTGLHSLDEFLQSELVLAAFTIMTRTLKHGGTFLAKVFRSRDSPLLYAQMKKFFKQVYLAKPRSSRASSCEAFLLCIDYSPPEGFQPTMERPSIDRNRELTQEELMNECYIDFVSCGDMSGWDSEQSYPLDLQLSYPRGSNVFASSRYVFHDVVQPPINPPYKKALELKRAGKLEQSLWEIRKAEYAKVREVTSDRDRKRPGNTDIGYTDEQGHLLEVRSLPHKRWQTTTILNAFRTVCATQLLALPVMFNFKDVFSLLLPVVEDLNDMTLNTATVVLDVEGVHFKTRISTLTSLKNSFFDKLFESNWRKSLTKEGHIFVDRDASLFPFVLNFLRDGEATPLPRDEFVLHRILQEANYFKLGQLRDYVERRLASMTKVMEFDTPPQLPATKPPLPPPTEKPAIQMPMRKSEADKKNKLKKVDSISLPRNFTHVAHVGWTGNGVVFDNASDDVIVQKIANAASEALDFDAVYNVVNGENGDGSHSVEVVLAGGMMQSKLSDNAPPIPKKTVVLLLAQTQRHNAGGRIISIIGCVGHPIVFFRCNSAVVVPTVAFMTVTSSLLASLLLFASVWRSESTSVVPCMLCTVCTETFESESTPTGALNAMFKKCDRMGLMEPVCGQFVTENVKTMFQHAKSGIPPAAICRAMQLCEQ